MSEVFLYSEWADKRHRDRPLEFGKHKGVLWSEVPIEYLKWLRKQEPSSVRRHNHVLSAMFELDYRRAVDPTDV